VSRRVLFQSIGAILAVILIGIVLFLALGSKKTNTDDVVEIKLHYVYGLQSIDISLSDNEFVTVKDILHNKSLVKENSSDEFSKDISFELITRSDSDSKYFCIARDGSANVKSSSDSMYFSLSEQEYSDLLDIFISYCGSTPFPCE